MFGPFKKEKTEMSKFEQHCSLYNEFYASMYQDFCFKEDEIKPYEEISPYDPQDIDLLETLTEMEEIIGMRIGSVKISENITLINEWSSCYNFRHISIQIGENPILVQTWKRKRAKEFDTLENASILHEKYLGHIQYVCSYVSMKVNQKLKEDRLRESGEIERAIKALNCKETSNDR